MHQLLFYGVLACLGSFQKRRDVSQLRKKAVHSINFMFIRLPSKKTSNLKNKTVWQSTDLLCMYFDALLKKKKEKTKVYGFKISPQRIFSALEIM